MATASPMTSTDDGELCVLCSSKYNRDRPSFCQCKHCSIPLCMDCMKEHHEELLQDVPQISHQYNELKELLQRKQLMIVEETEKSMANVNQQFDTYIAELRDTQREILLDMEKTKQNAQEYVLKIESDLHTLGGEIQGLAKENIVKTTKMKNLSKELKKIQHHLNVYQVSRTENLNRTKPEFSIKFDCSPIDAEKPHSTDTVTNSQEPTLKSNILDIRDQSGVLQEYPINQMQGSDHLQDDDDDKSWVADDDSTEGQDSHIQTTYRVNMMASDGINVLYTSYYDDGEPDLIAYCFIEDDSGKADQYRDWKQSRIIDMIWWNSIGTFICATYDGIYRVGNFNRSFKITCVVREKWSYIRVASNTHELFLWENSTENGFNGINVYSTKFEHIRTINFNTRPVGSFTDRSVSFCMTENMIASICMRMQNNRQVFQVVFCDMDMNKLRSVPLGKCSDDIEIRTDGDNQFFITTGGHQFYVVRSDGAKREINLEDDGACIAVLDHQRIAVSNGRDSMEILTY